MTIKTAQKILAGPLVLGDPRQVEAKQFLQELDKARKRLMNCQHCRGEGTNHRGYYCEWCAAHFHLDVLWELGIYAYEMPP